MEIRSFILVLFLSICTVANSDIESEKAALLAFRSAVGRFIKWNSNGTPCNWTGITCEAGRVVTFRLPGVGLIGSIPIGTIGNLTKLRTLSLRFNGLTGELPSDLEQCSDLRNLYLQGNQFSGEIPSFLFELRELVRLNLAGNNFSGEIPEGLSNLTRLGTLYLENNQLTGSIPNLNLTSLTQFNVSLNHLNGSIPENLRKWDENSFLGNALCGGKLNPCEGTNISLPGESPSSKKKRKLSGGAIAGIVIGSVLGFLLLLVLLLLCCKKSENKTKSLDMAKIPPQPSEVQDPDKTANGEGRANGNHSGFQPGTASVQSATPAPVSGDSKKLVIFAHGGSGKEFDLEDLLRASAEVLGKGTFGTAYKAVLEIGTVVAVKRLRDVTISEGEFREKIEAVGAMNHENLVPLRAYYYSKDEKLLVYDYMPMGSLSALLHGNRGAGRTPLNWETRSGIALSAAKGVEYLHRQSSTTSHGNIKSSNILLTKNYEARVSDFGLATLVGTVTAPTRVAGYRAPEVTDIRKVSQKADIYSFGVLLLELLTGKAPTHAVLNEEGVDLPRWVQSVVREDWTSEVFDLELLRYQTVEEEMVQLLQLAIDCCAQFPDKRPPMTEVVNRIEELRQMSLNREEQDNSLVDDANVESGSSLP